MLAARRIGVSLVVHSQRRVVQQHQRRSFIPEMIDKVKSLVAPRKPSLYQRSGLDKSIDQVTAPIGGVTGFVLRRVMKTIAKVVTSKTEETMDEMEKITHVATKLVLTDRYFKTHFGQISKIDVFDVQVKTINGKGSVQVTLQVAGSKATGRAIIDGSFIEEKDVFHVHRIAIATDSGEQLYYELADMKIPSKHQFVDVQVHEAKVTND